MSRLFIDVDDTLILWPAEPGTSDDWRPNHDVISFALEWMKYHPEGECIVWSTGGAEYAARFRHALLPSSHSFEAKYPCIVRPGDLFIDDDPLPSYREATLHPHILGTRR